MFILLSNSGQLQRHAALWTRDVANERDIQMLAVGNFGINFPHFSIVEENPQETDPVADPNLV